MDNAKSLDADILIAALLHDVSRLHGLVFNTRSLRLTVNKVNSRLRMEGIGFLTKTLPRLGKALESALIGGTPLSAAKLGFKPMPNSELPIFLGEFFKLVLLPNGTPLPQPCAQSVKVIRQIAYWFYKYELPYSDEQEQKALATLERTEQELVSTDQCLPSQGDLDFYITNHRLHRLKPHDGQGIPYPFTDGPISTDANRLTNVKLLEVTRKAQLVLSDIFAYFDPMAIHPKHGPGAVSTKETLERKYLWTNVSDRITDVYPFDAYFCASLGHICDTAADFSDVSGVSNSARVVLVPKDSRGPRVISCEPLDNQWIQQGLMRAIVKLVESHAYTKCNVNFTHQSPNRIAALHGSANGRYATLDLKEASDRITLKLVRLLFPQNLHRFLECCRSSSTVLPDGRVLELLKFAPMGSGLCFPILALTVYSILVSGAPDAYTRERILVYGDDVIVPTAFAADAMILLESFGLKVNRDKSCTGGLFRESCGMDAFNGTDVTPVRLRTVPTHHQSPDVYTSWIAYANSMYDRQCYRVYDTIVEWLVSIYGPIPGEDMHLACPSLRNAPDYKRPFRTRWNTHLQKVEYLVRDVKAPSSVRSTDGWAMLLRFFAEAGDDLPMQLREVDSVDRASWNVFSLHEAFSVSKYTSRRSSCLIRRWR